MGVYVAFCAAYVTFTLFRTTNNLLAALRASRQVHEQSLVRLVRAPLSFFDTTPVGRILNRYSKVLVLVCCHGARDCQSMR